MRLNVRIKLNDFIGNGEEIVVEKLKQAWNQNKQFSVHFWYEEDSLKPKQIKDFISEYETELKKLYYDNNAEYEIMILRYFNPIGSYNSRNMGEDLKENPPNIFPRICNVANGFDKKLCLSSCN